MDEAPQEPRREMTKSLPFEDKVTFKLGPEFEEAMKGHCPCSERKNDL